ncbi:MAG: mechanosensitive ion channel family protein [Alphaproteobacteria bacterium]|nr:mechanosensitive ion channel family protein [Alphaproteobacteria bacterium]MCW5743404.1 mechanosensitive ion channel family protein [Alphaproteobacteria bacterium]
MVPILARAVAVLALLMAFGTPVAAQSGKAPDASSPKVRLLLDLLADPEIRTWLEKRAAEKPKPEPAVSDASLSSVITGQMTRVRNQVQAMSAAAPRLPDELGRAFEILRLEFEERGEVELVLLIAAFAALGYGVAYLFWRRTERIRQWIAHLPLHTVRERLLVVLARLAFGLVWLAAFAAGSVGAFLAFNWPPLLREIVLAYLMAFLVARLAFVAGNFLLSPGFPRFRIVPMDEDGARFWHRRLVIFVAWFAFTAVSLTLLKTLGLSSEARRLIGATTALGLVGIALEAIWRRRVADHGQHVRRLAANWGLSAFVVAMWLLRVGDVMPMFWSLLVLVGAPLLIRVTGRSVSHLLRPPGTETMAGEVPGVGTVVLERGLRALIVVGAVFLLARAWGVEIGELTSGDSVWTRLTRGVASAVVIGLVADLVWQILRAVIDRRLAEARGDGPVDEEEARRRARLNTLLPIFRNILAIVVVAVAIMMALSALGVEIGPLIAGAGVVGVALGFGAQTLVRDIISGMFFLLDDAFRIGEYIQAGAYKGRVESFSLRSIKLRHHRGSLYTVPFGVLGAVQNSSRDWVIDKLTIGITYDSNIDEAKKIIKRVGKELAEIPDFKPHILQPLKMQGVEKFSDSAIEIRLKLMTKPGEQFAIRRRGYAMIKKAFDEAGIKFARPMALLAEGAGTDPAAVVAARQVMAKPEPAAG